MLDTKIYIDNIKKKAKKHYNETMPKNQYIMIIYTDESGIKGNVEVATYCPTLQ